MKKVVLELPDDQAMALAQLAKRLGYDDAERLSSRYDGGEERDAMLWPKPALAGPHPGAGFSSRSDTPYTVPCTRISATQHTADRCPSWKG